MQTDAAPLWLRGLAAACAVALGVAFLLAAFSKIGDLAEFHRALETYRFLPEWLRGVTVFFLPGLELTLGVCLLTRMALRETSLVTAMLLMAFVIVSVGAYWNGIKGGCPCYKLVLPFWMNLSGKWVAARNVGFLAMSLLVLLTPFKKRPFAVAQGDKL